MTLRKFLRFFKHFPYYMKKDFNWLKRKINVKKSIRHAKKIEAVNKKNSEKFVSVVKTLVSKLRDGNTKVFYFAKGKYLFLLSSVHKYDYVKMWKNEDTLYIQDVNKKVKKYAIPANIEWTHLVKEEADIGLPENKDDKLIELMMLVTTIRDMNCTSVEKENDNTYHIYRKYGKQPARREYTIKFTGPNDLNEYEITVKTSRGGIVNTYFSNENPVKMFKLN